MQKPNIIVFMTDQQRHDTCGFHGNPLDLTPNLDMAAAKGTDIHYCFTCQPVCGPARAALQTGLYPTQNGAFTNLRPMPEDSVTLAGLFNENGYRTGYIGKWHLSGTNPVPEAKRGGYRDWLASDVLEFTSDAYRTRLYDNDNQAIDLPGYRVDALTDAAIRYVNDHKSEPFFLWVSFIEPHFQNHLDSYPAPDGYDKRYAGRWTPPYLQAKGGSSARHLPGYYGMVKRLDEAYGRLNDALKSLSLSENTVVLFVTDHSCHFKTRNSEYKRSGHENSIRIPCVLTGPGFDGGGRVKSLVSSIDIPPTLLGAAGITAPKHFMGRSFLPLVWDRDYPWKDDVYVQISEESVSRAIRTSRYKYIAQAIGADGWQDAGSDEYTETELYDLHADPYEMVNLIGYESHQKLTDILRGRMLARMKETGEGEPRIIKAKTIPSGSRVIYDHELNL